MARAAHTSEELSGRATPKMATCMVTAKTSLMFWSSKTITTVVVCCARSRLDAMPSFCMSAYPTGLSARS